MRQPTHFGIREVKDERRAHGALLCLFLGYLHGNEVADVTPKKTRPDQPRLDRIVAQARRYKEEREQDYREQALKLYPWICGRCGREFTRENLQELTVHHRDHNHDNNPPDGSNWELLCLYCHDNEHMRHVDQVRYGETKLASNNQGSGTFQPFADLASLLKQKQ